MLGQRQSQLVILKKWQPNARGTSTAVATIPTLQVAQTLESFKAAVDPHTWQDEMALLLSSPVGKSIANLLFQQSSDTLKAKLMSCFIAWAFHDSGITLMHAVQNAPPGYMVRPCATWAQFNTGQIRVTNTDPDACKEKDQRLGSIKHRRWT